MDVSELDFELPEELIALRPAEPRSSARLLVYEQQAVRDAVVSDLPAILRRGDRLVFNNTRVIPAMISGTRTRPGLQAPSVEVSVNLDRRMGGRRWRVLAKPGRRLKQGDSIRFGDSLCAMVVAKQDSSWLLEFNCGGREFAELLNEAGSAPLPPYITSRRRPDERDRSDYQAVFARHDGSVAAPTASLHFGGELLGALRSRGINSTFVTLHVGAGTFLPIKSSTVEDHKVHAEWGMISAEAAREINSTKASGGRVVVVGTTALRLIESAARGGSLREWNGDTSLFIRPGYRLQIADGLVTNFHLPRSTLIVLVAALVGRSATRGIYAHAIQSRYRFYSYGDCSLLFP